MAKLGEDALSFIVGAKSARANEAQHFQNILTPNYVEVNWRKDGLSAHHAGVAQKGAMHIITGATPVLGNYDVYKGGELVVDRDATYSGTLNIYGGKLTISGTVDVGSAVFARGGMSGNQKFIVSEGGEVNVASSGIVNGDIFNLDKSTISVSGNVNGTIYGRGRVHIENGGRVDAFSGATVTVNSGGTVAGIGFYGKGNERVVTQPYYHDQGAGDQGGTVVFPAEKVPAALRQTQRMVVGRQAKMWLEDMLPLHAAINPGLAAPESGVIRSLMAKILPQPVKVVSINSEVKDIPEGGWKVPANTELHILPGGSIEGPVVVSGSGSKLIVRPGGSVISEGDGVKIEHGGSLHMGGSIDAARRSGSTPTRKEAYIKGHVIISVGEVSMDSNAKLNGRVDVDGKLSANNGAQIEGDVTVNRSSLFELGNGAVLTGGLSSRGTIIVSGNVNGEVNAIRGHGGFTFISPTGTVSLLKTGDFSWKTEGWGSEEVPLLSDRLLEVAVHGRVVKLDGPAYMAVGSKIGDYQSHITFERGVVVSPQLTKEKYDALVERLSLQEEYKGKEKGEDVYVVKEK